MPFTGFRMGNRPWPVWYAASMEAAVGIRNALVRRSLLVASPLDAAGLAPAAASGADALVIDVAHEPAGGHRAEARHALGGALAAIARSGSDLLLWTDVDGAVDDLAACPPGTISGVLITAQSRDGVAAVDAALARWEESCGMTPGVTDVTLVLATGLAVSACAALARASQRVVALALDEPALLRTAIAGDGAGRDLAAYYRGAIVVVARTLAVQAYGVIAAGAGPLAAGYATAGRRMGLHGAVCFDPDAVSQVNAGFSPSEGQVVAARRLLAAMDVAVAEGRGAIAAAAGTMADLANARQAQAVVDRADAIRRRVQPPLEDAPAAADPPTEEGSAWPWR